VEDLAVVESLAPSIEVTRVPPLLATKLQAPAVRRELVGRGSLVNRLREGAAGRMTVVTAPPGWGKTTLLAAWRLVEGGRPPFAWVSLDAGDNDPARFWSYVVEALRAADPALEATLGPVRPVGSGAPADVVVPRVVNALAEHDERVVLVLDDYHSIATPEVHTALAALIERAPAALHVALASRAEPPLPLGRLRARGELSEVSTDALRFSGREAAVLFNGVLDLGLTGHDVERLHRRTEGWAAGLYLAALSLRGRADPADFIADFAGDDRLVSDYLSSEMLDGVRAEVRGFLLETSILERLCGPLCDAVTGRTDSARLLAEIERSNLFLVPLDRRRHWYRYHGLFGDLLRRRLDLSDPDRAAVLHARALAWHLEAGTVREAIHHALAADDRRAARDLVAEHWNRYFNQGRLATVRAWLDALEPAAVLADPRLCAACAWLELDAGRVEAAAPWIEAAERAVAGLRAEDVPPSSAAETAVLRAVHAFKAGDIGAAGEAAQRARLVAPVDQSFSLTVAECVRGFTAFWAGRAEAAAGALEEARRLARGDGNLLAEAYATGYLAMLAAGGGELAEADALADAALALSDEPGFTTHFGLHAAHVARAAARAARGDRDGAIDAATRAVELAQGAGRVEVAGAQIELARARLARGDRAEAREALTRARSVLADCADPGVASARAEELEARLSPGRGTVARAGEALTEREADVLRLLAGPLSRREIAAALYVSPDTVKTHSRGIYRKLSASTRSEAVEAARARGLL
jgi:LuxR family transcriptional regulator, maltose regulon positive regulatory protein